MLATTVHHALMAAGELSALQLSQRLGLHLEETYAELARLDALDAARMRQTWPSRKFVWRGIPHVHPHEA